MHRIVFISFFSFFDWWFMQNSRIFHFQKGGYHYGRRKRRRPSLDWRQTSPHTVQEKVRIDESFWVTLYKVQRYKRVIMAVRMYTICLTYITSASIMVGRNRSDPKRETSCHQRQVADRPSHTYETREEIGISTQSPYTNFSVNLWNIDWSLKWLCPF